MRKKMIALMLAGCLASSSIGAKTDFISTYYGTKGIQSLIEAGLQAFQSGADLIFTGVGSIIKFMKHPQRFLAERYFKLKNLRNKNMLLQQTGLSEKQLRRLQRKSANLNFNIKFIEKIFPKKTFSTVEEAMKGRLAFDQINLKKRLNKLEQMLQKAGKWMGLKSIRKQIGKIKKNLREIESITGKMAQ